MQAAWGAFFRNCTARRGSRFSAESKIRLIARAVEPVLRFRWARWPFQVALAARLDRLQSAIYAAIQRKPRESWESPQKFAQERRKKAKKAARHIGLWSHSWAKRVLDWNQHISNDGENSTPGYFSDGSCRFSHHRRACG